jgi:BioD-like phosphotransacetylase family protein
MRIMAGLLLVSAHPFSGQTAVATGLARRLSAHHNPARITRTGDDPHAAPDTAFYDRLRLSGDFAITETPTGDIGTTLLGHTGLRAIIVATPLDNPAGVASYIRASGPVSGVILNRIPERRIDAVRSAYESAGVHPLAIIPEDRLLAAPTVGQVFEALSADGVFIKEHIDEPLDNPVIASIAADPGQTYFTRTQTEAVIVRSDKPDLQLAALNAGAGCLIVTGGLPVLSYVNERVAEDEIPLLRTKLDTKQTVSAIEELFGTAPFTGDAKVKRIESHLAHLDLDALLERSAV